METYTEQQQFTFFQKGKEPALTVSKNLTICIVSRSCFELML